MKQFNYESVGNAINNAGMKFNLAAAAKIISPNWGPRDLKDFMIENEIIDHHGNVLMEQEWKFESSYGYTPRDQYEKEKVLNLDILVSIDGLVDLQELYYHKQEMEADENLVNTNRE